MHKPAWSGGSGSVNRFAQAVQSSDSVNRTTTLELYLAAEGTRYMFNPLCDSNGNCYTKMVGGTTKRFYQLNPAVTHIIREINESVLLSKGIGLGTSSFNLQNIHIKDSHTLVVLQSSPSVQFDLQSYKDLIISMVKKGKKDVDDTLLKAGRNEEMETTEFDDYVQKVQQITHLTHLEDIKLLNSHPFLLFIRERHTYATILLHKLQGAGDQFGACGTLSWRVAYGNSVARAIDIAAVVSKYQNTLPEFDKVYKFKPLIAYSTAQSVSSSQGTNRYKNHPADEFEYIRNFFHHVNGGKAEANQISLETTCKVVLVAFSEAWVDIFNFVWSIRNSVKIELTD